MTFGRKLRAACLRQDLTQAALAAWIGVSPNTMSYLETSQREPSLRVLKKLAETLGVSIDDLLSVDRTKAPVKGNT